MSCQLEITNEVEVSRVKEIVHLHNQIGGYLKASLNNAIRIGALLVEQKESLPHGEFTAWVNANLPFTDRTARSYMRVYRERDLLKTENVSVLSEGYKLLAERALGLSDMSHFNAAIYWSRLSLDEMSEILESPEATLGQIQVVQKAAFQLQNAWAEWRIRLERTIEKGINNELP